MCRTLRVLVEIGEENWVLDLKTPYVFVCNVSINSFVIITAKKMLGARAVETRSQILHRTSVRPTFPTQF